jgi:hypothetical protein
MYTAPTPIGNLLFSGTWRAQDAAQTRLIGQSRQLNGMPLLVDLYPEIDDSHFAGGTAVKVARNSYEISFIQYYLRKPEPNVTVIVGMAIITGTLELTGPDSLLGQGTAAYYLSELDADQNGLPDEGQEPVLQIPWQWIGQCLGMMQ